VSDGTEAGTVLVKDINPAGTAASFRLLARQPDGSWRQAVLHGRRRAHGNELWESDGTEAGTVLVKDINPGSSYGFPAGSSPNNLTAVGGALYFTAADGVSGPRAVEVRRHESGTALVRTFNPGRRGSYPAYLTAVGGKLFFAAGDGVSGRELWKSDGTESGTALVKDINPGSSYGFPADSSLRNLTAVGGLL